MLLYNSTMFNHGPESASNMPRINIIERVKKVNAYTERLNLAGKLGIINVILNIISGGKIAEKIARQSYFSFHEFDQS